VDWQDDLKRLQENGENASFLDKLTAYKAVRTAGVIDPDLTFFAIAYLLMNAAVEQMMTNQTLAGITERLHEIERDGTDDERTRRETETLMHGWEVISEDMMVAFFSDHAELKMAELYRDDRAEFDRRYEHGREMIFGPRPPEGGKA